jgi:hypothetical protein
MGWVAGQDLKAMSDELHNTLVAQEETLNDQQKIELRRLQGSLSATQNALTDTSLAFWRAIRKQKKEQNQLFFGAAGAFLLYLALDFLGWWPKFDLARAVMVIAVVGYLCAVWVRDELKIDALGQTKKLLERDWAALNQTSNWAGAAIEWARDNEQYADDWPEDHQLRSAIIFLRTRLALVDLVSDRHTVVVETVWSGSNFYM